MICPLRMHMVCQARLSPADAGRHASETHLKTGLPLLCIGVELVRLLEELEQRFPTAAEAADRDAFALVLPAAPATLHCIVGVVRPGASARLDEAEEGAVSVDPERLAVLWLKVDLYLLLPAHGLVAAHVQLDSKETPDPLKSTSIPALMRRGRDPSANVVAPFVVLGGLLLVVDA